MRLKKFLLAGLAGGVTYFLLGWVVYGILLSGYVAQTLGTTIGINRLDMSLWALLLSNFSFGFLLSFTFVYIGRIGSTGTGGVTGSAIGFFSIVGFDLLLYSTNYMGPLQTFLVDIISFTLISGLTGAVMGAITGFDQKDPGLTLPV